MALAGLKEPVFEMDGFFRAIFFRPKREDIFPTTLKVGEKVGEKITANQQKIIDSILKEPTISAKELSGLVGISQRKIEDNIAKLKKGVNQAHRSGEGWALGGGRQMKGQASRSGVSMNNREQGHLFIRSTNNK